MVGITPLALMLVIANCDANALPLRATPQRLRLVVIVVISNRGINARFQLFLRFREQLNSLLQIVPVRITDIASIRKVTLTRARVIIHLEPVNALRLDVRRFRVNHDLRRLNAHEAHILKGVRCLPVKAALMLDIVQNVRCYLRGILILWVARIGFRVRPAALLIPKQEVDLALDPV